MLNPVFENASLNKLSSAAAHLEASPLQSALAATSRPGLISLAMGLPDPSLLPHQELAHFASQVLRSGGSSLQYRTPCEPLKEFICGMMERRGVHCTPDSILLTQGAQQGLHLLSTMFVDKGSVIIEEEFTYPGFQNLIDLYRPHAVAIRTDQTNGIDVTHLKLVLSSGAKPALLYLMPTAHNPLGVTLPLRQRRELLALAQQFSVPIVEDDPYSLLYYELEPPDPLISLDNVWIHYVGSFSKVLGPSLRIGWIIATASAIRILSRLKESADLDVSTLSQWIANEYLRSGNFASHVARLRSKYLSKRDLMHASLQKTMPDEVTWEIPGSGVFFWLSLPNQVNASKLLSVAIQEEGVSFLPAEAFSRNRRSDGLRLNFSAVQCECIPEGVAKIGKLLKRFIYAAKSH